MSRKEALKFFDEAFEEIKDEYMWEIKLTQLRKFEDLTIEVFYDQYAFVVFNAGMKNQIAEMLYERFIHELNFKGVGHPGKRKGLKHVWDNVETIYFDLHEAKDKLEFLQTLPWIGPITKYHLARNIGLDVAKPDRHLVRLAKRFGYGADVARMCDELAYDSCWRVGTVDVVLWRYCNLHPEIFK